MVTSIEGRLRRLEADSPTSAGNRCQGCGRLQRDPPCPWSVEELLALPREELLRLHAATLAEPHPLACPHCGRPDDHMAGMLTAGLGAEAAAPVVAAFARGDDKEAVRLLSLHPREVLRQLYRASLRD